MVHPLRHPTSTRNILHVVVVRWTTTRMGEDVPIAVLLEYNEHGMEEAVVDHHVIMAIIAFVLWLWDETYNNQPQKLQPTNKQIIGT